jgi:hypothetical protein
MSELESEPRRIALAGRAWNLAPLPFRLMKKIQPRLLLRIHEIGDSATAALRLDEATLEDLAECVFLAIAMVDLQLTRDAFFDLPFSSHELLATMPALLAVCGLRPQSAGAAAELAE